MEEKKINSKVPRDYEWMIRPCHIYQEEYRDCTSLRARFHQYFIHGEAIDCSKWKQDMENCKLWDKAQNEEAFNALLNNERERRYTRLKPHYNNDVWKKREKPPENWNDPLPEWMQKEYEETYLNIKLQLDKEETSKSVNLLKQIFVCTIS